MPFPQLRGRSMQVSRPDIPTGNNFTQTLTESITLTDSIVKQAGKILSETITHTDTLIKQTAKIRSETITLTDTLLKQSSRTLSESVTLSDSLTRQAQKTLTESITLSDSLVRQIQKLLSESVALSDTVSKQSQKTLTESITMTDSLVSIRIFLKTLTETITLLDGVLGSPFTIDSYPETNASSGNSLYAGNYTKVGQAFTASADANLTKATFYIKRVGSPTGNAVAKLYALTGTPGSTAVPTGAALATSDNVDVSTLSTSNANVDFTFSAGNQYAMTNGVSYGISLEYSGGDSLNRVDWNHDSTSPSHGGNMYRSSGTYAAEPTLDLCFYVVGATLTAGLIKQIGKLQSDTITLTDTLNKQTTRTFLETITYSDTLVAVRAFLKTLSESLTLSDTLSKQSTKVLSETTTLSDTLTKQTSKTRTETITLTDTLLALKTFLKTLSESVTLTDSLVKQAQKTLSDSLTYTDSVAKQTSKTRTESITYTDSLSKQAARVFVESITYTDSLVRQIGKRLSETLTMTDTVLKRTAKTFLESTTLTDFLDAVKVIAAVPVSIGMWILYSLTGRSRTLISPPKAVILSTPRVSYVVQLSQRGGTLSTGVGSFTLRQNKTP